MLAQILPKHGSYKYAALIGLILALATCHPWLISFKQGQKDHTVVKQSAAHASATSATSFTGPWLTVWADGDGTRHLGSLSLEQSENKLSGKGSDGEGPFVVQGEVSYGQSIKLKKQYVGIDHKPEGDIIRIEARLDPDKPRLLPSPPYELNMVGEIFTRQHVGHSWASRIEIAGRYWEAGLAPNDPTAIR